MLTAGQTPHAVIFIAKQWSVRTERTLAYTKLVTLTTNELPAHVIMLTGNKPVLLTLVVLATAEFPEGIRAAIPKGLPLKIVSQGVPFAHSVKGKKLQSTRLMGGLIPAKVNYPATSLTEGPPSFLREVGGHSPSAHLPLQLKRRR